MTRFIATLGYTGLIPWAPGTFGSFVALLLAIWVYYLGGIYWYLALWLILTVVGYLAVAAETRGNEDADPGEIVIDELSGQWIAVAPALWWIDINLYKWMTTEPSLMLQFNAAWNVGALLLPALVAFAAFRFFDILKPYPVSRADRMKTPLGVMLDDVLAGIYAALVVLLFMSAFAAWAASIFYRLAW